MQPAERGLDGSKERVHHRAWRQGGMVVGTAGTLALIVSLFARHVGQQPREDAGPNAPTVRSSVVTLHAELPSLTVTSGSGGALPDDALTTAGAPDHGGQEAGRLATGQETSPPLSGVQISVESQQNGEFAPQDGDGARVTSAIIPLGEERIAVFSRDGREHRVAVTYNAGDIVLDGRRFSLSTKGKIPFTRIAVNATLTINSVEDLPDGQRRMTAGAYGISGTMTSSKEAAQNLCLELLQEGCATVIADDGRKITIRESALVTQADPSLDP